YGRVYAAYRGYGVAYADVATNVPVNSEYELLNRYSGLAADNRSGSMTPGVQLVQSAINGNNSQQWMLENLGGGNVKLVNQTSGLVLAMAAGALTNGAPVVQSAWANTDNQKWLLTPTDSGYYKLINVASGKTLEVTGGSAAVGTGLDQGSDAGANYQQWTFAPTSPAMMKLAGTVIGSTGSWGNSGNTITNVFDGNMSTYFDAVNATGDWAGLDMGSGALAVVTQIKYCPRSGLGSRMVGGQFQGANVADFSSGVVTLFTVGSAPPDGVMTVQAVTNAASFRYLRYLGPAYGYCNVAEVEFWGVYAVTPPAPAGLNAAAGDAQVTLNWNLANGATGYKVKRSTVSGNGYTSIATNASLVFTNTGLNNGTLYYFVVSATNVYGESVNSAEVSVRPVSRAAPQLGYGTTAGQMQLSWPTDHTGWQLQVQTNSLASGLGTNWRPVPGSTATNLMNMPVNATAGGVFYRLFLP
ncbi:MAG TPA: RICIN domain-containing protein, partial [Verrucomicrobiae bacterium]